VSFATEETAVPAASAEVRPRTFVRRLAKKKLTMVSLAYLGAVVGIAAIAPLVLSSVLTERSGDLTQVNQLPSAEHWLGTDGLGRDVLERLLAGTGVTMLGVGQALAVVLCLGVPLGLVAGYFGGRIDSTIRWFTDLMLSLPSIILILVVLAVVPQSLTAGMVSLGVLMSPGLTRVVRSAVLPIREELYVAAARVSGLTQPRIIFKHILPRVAGPIIVQGSLLAAAALVAQAGLAFLGLVVQPPAPSWGGMIADGIQTIVSNPWLIWPPGVMLALTTLAFGLLGDAVRDATAEGWSHAAGAGLKRPPVPKAGSAPVDFVGDDVLLAIRYLNVAFAGASGNSVRIVQDASFDIRRGEVLALVGESGCGKSATAMAILGGLPRGGFIESGRVLLEGRDLTRLSDRDLTRVRGREVAVISQEPMVSLNPAFKIGWQLIEVIRRHHRVGRREARERALDLLRQVRLPDPAAILERYPHELSGGMAQRVVIARALAGEPKLLIADEPTTALDVTVQAEILDLLRSLQQTRDMSVLLITHDWGVVADICDRAIVMYAGQVIESGDVEPLFASPRHPYTAGLIASDPHHASGDGPLKTIPGSVPSPGSWPEGCHFQTRCPFAIDVCRHDLIPLTPIGPSRDVRCIRNIDVASAGGWIEA
jgi:peptide/nickel transport system permease protein